MASLMQQGDRFYCQFLYHGKRHCFSLGDVGRNEAELVAAGVDKTLLRLKQGLLHLPPGNDIVTFVRHDGKPPEKHEEVTVRDVLTLGKLRDEYLKIHVGSLEKTTTDGIRLHFKHLVKTLGERFPMPELSLTSLQDHAERRKKMKGANGKISSATIKKELISLRTAWHWAESNGWVKGRFPPLKKVRLVKPEEKPHFQTYAEIERQLPGLTDAQAEELWDCLYLTLPEINQLLEHVKAHALQPWVYPLFCFAAHTGARRSEILRTRVSDIDFAGNTIIIHEKKRAHDKKTTRRVPLTPFLANVLKDWLAIHPGGAFVFMQSAKVVRSKKKRAGATAVTRDEAHDHFKRTLAESKWKVLRGYHALRHSFISCLASAGVDQRIIDDFVGHQTDEQRKRYRHLYPNVKQEALARVFG